MNHLSRDVEAVISALLADGVGVRAAARFVGVSKDTVVKVREGRTVPVPKPRGPYKKRQP